MDRRDFLTKLGLGLLGTAALPGCGRWNPQGAEKPNILFIAVDDLRPQLGCYGHSEIVSPNIDRLAARGTVFERAYCNVPTCGPSRISVLTGRRTTTAQWRTEDLKKEFTTLPRLLGQHGYTTRSNGKVFHYMHDRQEDWSRPPWRSTAIYYGEGDWAGYNN